MKFLLKTNLRLRIVGNFFGADIDFVTSDRHHILLRLMGANQQTGGKHRENIQLRIY